MYAYNNIAFYWLELFFLSFILFINYYFPFKYISESFNTISINGFVILHCIFVQHLNSELHQNFINKEKYFDGVVNVISSLPQASDFLSSLSEAEKNSKMVYVLKCFIVLLIIYY